MTHSTELDDLWARHSGEWRDPAQITAQWEDAATVNPRLLRHSAAGDWWDVLARTGVTLLITREYEHLVMGLAVEDGRPKVTFMRIPHPSGLAVDLVGERVHIASTRNPNQVYEFAPVASTLDTPPRELVDRPLVPLSSAFYPGSLYMHDLALIKGRLHANAVGQNAVVRLGPGGHWERVWWPASIETSGRPDFRLNYLQLNSIAAGSTVRSSYFSASSATVSARRPGHLNFPVDGRGVIFSGRTREPVASGLTRPHSARLHNGALWVDNSGYGEVGVIDNGAFNAVARLPGWTRGLCFVDDIAFVGTSRIIPRFARYAPGLDPGRSVCAAHALDLRSGAVLGSITWPAGNQLFAIESIPGRISRGFPFRAGKRPASRTKHLFYSFRTDSTGGTDE